MNVVISALCKWIRELIPGIHTYDFNPEQDLLYPCAIVEENYSYISKQIQNGENRRFYDIGLFSVHVLDKTQRGIRDIVDTIRLNIDNLNLTDEIRGRVFGVSTDMNNMSGYVQFYMRLYYQDTRTKYVMQELDFKEKVIHE